MKSILCSPHDDDAHLFAAFTCLREKPTVIVCFESWIQPRRGENGCSAAERAAETDAACKITGNDVIHLGIRDDQERVKSVEFLKNALAPYTMDQTIEWVYAPARQGGNVHHDIVNYVAQMFFTHKVIEYTTYTSDQLYTTGTYELVPTREEFELKRQALGCYPSQLRINRPHFNAVLGKSEWLNKRGNRTLHLGCGKNLVRGWTNMDRVDYRPFSIFPDDGPLAPLFTKADVTDGIPYPNNSFDYVFSEDFLEHLPPEKRVFVINQIWRVLEPDGIMEHFLPNAGSQNDFGSPSHLSHWNGQTFEHFDVGTFRWEKDRHHEGIVAKFRKETAELMNWRKEDDGVIRAQGLHVKYRAVKP